MSLLKKPHRRPTALAPERATHLAEMLRAVAHPLRLRLIECLSDADERVSTLAERLGAPQAIVSQQLRILRMSRLVLVTRDHTGATYRLAEPRLRDLLVCLRACSIATRR